VLRWVSAPVQDQGKVVGLRWASGPRMWRKWSGQSRSLGCAGRRKIEKGAGTAAGPKLVRKRKKAQGLFGLYKPFQIFKLILYFTNYFEFKLNLNLNHSNRNINLIAHNQYKRKLCKDMKCIQTNIYKA
jgi:hypothetical protein